VAILITTKPIRRNDPASHIVVDRRPEPAERIPNQAVFDGIVVDVVHVAGEILLVANEMLPEAPLPEIVFAAPVAGEGNPITRQCAGEPGLDGAPAAGISASPGGKVQMV
jgi:hypothetical protein